jgi:predicted nucleic acid-binding protein
MGAYSFDTSGIVKRYIRETGSAWVERVADPAAGHRIYLSRVTAVEVTSAVTRRSRSGSLSTNDAAILLARFRMDLAQEYRIVEVTPALLSRAMVLAESYGLRAYDAVQLSTAVELHERRANSGQAPLTLVSADRELNAAATASGLMVEDPNHHP